MCGASSELKAISATAKTLATDASNEAKTVFGASSSVFNNLISGLQRIVTGGPNQQGMSAGEFNAQQAANAQNTATLARNAIDATGAQVAAIGGGNTVTPAGSTENAMLQTRIAAGEAGAAAQNALVSKDYEIGRENFFKASDMEAKLPDVFNPATSAESGAVSANKEALSAQQAIDTQNNWWQPMVTAAIGGLSSGITGGGLGKMFSRPGGGTPPPNTANTSASGGGGSSWDYSS